MIERLYIENYGCIRRLQLHLSPLHALIGPNDSGKSTVLRALRTLSILASRSPGQWLTDNEETHSLQEALIANADERTRTFIEAFTDKQGWQIIQHGREWDQLSENLSLARAAEPQSVALTWSRGSSLVHNHDKLRKALTGSHLVRLDPDALRQPSSLIPQDQPLRFGTRGYGLPGVYDAIFARNFEVFNEINEGMRELFSAVDKLSLTNPSADKKAIGIKLRDGKFVPAKHMSEGFLYCLAFAAIPYLERAALVLVEEPENGLHPARIAEVRKVLRKISETMQVVIATHLSARDQRARAA